MKWHDPKLLIKNLLNVGRNVGAMAFALLSILFFAPSYGQEQPQYGGAENRRDILARKAESGETTGKYTLSMLVQHALKNNPRIRIAGRDIETETYGIDSAKADRMPRVDLGGGVARYRYDMPLTPVVIEPPFTPSTEFPVFRRTVYDTGLSFKLPLFRGGRLYRAVNVAELKREMARDNYRMSRQELVYNVSSVYYKILQLEKLLIANDGSVRQYETHKGNVEVFLRTGTVPKLDLLKTEVELSHAMESRLLVKNSLSSSYELLKTLMGMDNQSAEISVIQEEGMNRSYQDLEQSLDRAFLQRSDYKAVAKKRLIGEERVKMAEGKRLPDIFAAGQYGGVAGTDTQLKENWYYGLRLSMPILDWGLIRAEINKEKVELEKTKEEERSIRLSITRDVRDAHLTIANALERIEVTEKAIDSARESLRVEKLKYDTGAGTSQEVIDAQTAMLRAEANYYQAIFDRDAAVAYLKKAIGEDEYDPEVGK
jgi:outer membrane protein